MKRFAIAAVMSGGFISPALLALLTSTSLLSSGCGFFVATYGNPADAGCNGSAASGTFPASMNAAAINAVMVTRCFTTWHQ